MRSRLGGCSLDENDLVTTIASAIATEDMKLLDVAVVMASGEENLLALSLVMVVNQHAWVF